MKMCPECGREFSPVVESQERCSTVCMEAFDRYLGFYVGSGHRRRAAADEIESIVRESLVPATPDGWRVLALAMAEVLGECLDHVEDVAPRQDKELGAKIRICLRKMGQRI